jgi:acetylornithine/N-succinyldiaminopimelate aminotransferase
MNQRELFFKHVAQTSPHPLGLEIVRAKGLILYDSTGKEYIDCISGISVSHLGHGHPEVVAAIKEQADLYLHLLVYGELVQSPQVRYAQFLTGQLPASLNCVYFTNSGAEAVEGAMKLAKRSTQRTGILGFRQSYHGSTQGALSLMGDEYWRNAFRPLLPGISLLEYNEFQDLESISEGTACVVLEIIQAERGVNIPSADWVTALRRKCDQTGALLVIDEVQTGFGRTGRLWAFERFNIQPDILILGKALGGGMPLGAFIADRELMSKLSFQPVLGHITTFGGHPVSCAAGLAAMKFLVREGLVGEVSGKEELFRSLLIHPGIRAVRSAGLLISLEFENPEMNKRVIDRCLQKGLLLDWYLFAPQCMRLAPPLIIPEQAIRSVCNSILEAIEESH